jgi:hypothetical protein
MAMSVTAMLLTGSWVVGAVLAVFAGYYGSMLADWLVARHRRHHDE